MNIDYQTMPEVQEALQKLETMRQSDDLRAGSEIMLAPVDTLFTATMRVTDPALAQLVLLALLDAAPAINLPGLQIIGTSAKLADDKRIVKAWLEERLKELDS